MPSATSTKGVSCSAANKVTLIGSNCQASRVGRCVDCEGGRTAQIFSDCTITKYLCRATARWSCGRQTAVPCSCQTITIAAVLSLNDPGLQRIRPPAERCLAGRPVSRHLQRRQCWQAERRCSSVVFCYLLAAVRASVHVVLTYGEALSDRIVSYRDILCDIVSCPLWLYRAITTNYAWKMTFKFIIYNLLIKP